MNKISFFLLNLLLVCVLHENNYSMQKTLSKKEDIISQDLVATFPIDLFFGALLAVSPVSAVICCDMMPEGFESIKHNYKEMRNDFYYNKKMPNAAFNLLLKSKRVGRFGLECCGSGMLIGIGLGGTVVSTVVGYESFCRFVSKAHTEECHHKI